MIPLTAEGIGSLTTCADLDGPNAINFGPQLKDRPFHREIVVTNNARKLQQLVWHNITAEEKIKEAIKKRAAEEEGRKEKNKEVRKKRCRVEAAEEKRRAAKKARMDGGGGD